MKFAEILKWLSIRLLIEEDIKIGEKYLHFKNCDYIAMEKININLAEYEYFLQP